MNIDRATLVDELRAFALAGSGVVIGQPGVGKTHTLRSLRQRLRVEKVPHLILPVDQLGSGRLEELQSLLGFEGDFIAKLRHEIGGAPRPGILIFDGYDAARGENNRSEVLGLVRRTVNELRGIWNTIVSVRTFDAKKSQRLLELFPHTNSEPETVMAPCRQFLIPALREEEVEQALAQVPGLRQLHNAGTQDFHTLLTVPFNLWLIERVLGDGAKASEFSRITSEVQLLELYWDYRVRKTVHSEDREFILKKAAMAMVEDHTLTVRRDQIYQPEVRDAWEGLLSDEILCEVQEREVHVAFTHNILFDFAASVHLLEPDSVKFAQFVAAEPARPLFLRPSLVYHFTWLWHFNRNVFWRNFWDVVNRQEIHLRQIVRLVLPMVVVNESQSSEDLRPLLERLSRNEPLAAEAVTFVLHALRVLQSSKPELWAEFICAIGPHLDYRFAWDAGTIATQIIESEKPVTPKSFAHCGEFGRRLLGWAWTLRSDLEKRPWFERLAGLVAIPLVAKTYATGSSEARRLFEGVLAVVGETDFPIDCIHQLTNEVGRIILHDPDLAGLIYERVFGYEESSAAKTHMGGHVMPLISNRRQDYGMCRYSLIKEFPRFLATKPLAALRTGIRAVQAFAILDHVMRYVKDGKTLNELSIQFQFRGTTARYVEDGSAIWDESSYPDQELQIADNVFGWLAKAAKDARTEDLEQFLEVFVANANLAFLWARLLAVSAEHPAILGPRLWELAKTKPLLEEDGSLYSIGLFLERAFEFISEEQRVEVEQAILDLAMGASGEKKEFWERRRDRLLARIPSPFVVTQEAASLRSSLEIESKLPPNQPLFSFTSSSRTVTEEEFLLRQGAKPDSPANLQLRELYRPLKEWREKNKEESQIDILLPTACALKDSLANENNADPPVMRAAWTHLASFASDAVLITRSADTDRFLKLREIVLEAAAHPDPEFNPEYHSNWDSAAWSPAPRNEAAQALPWLTHFGEDRDALAAIQRLASDPVPSVRFLLACELWRLLEHSSDMMWSLFDKFATDETNSVVLQGVTVSLWKLIPRAKDRSLTLIGKLLEHVEEESEDEEKAGSNLVCMVVDYAVWENSEWAKQTLARWRGEAVESASSIATAGRRLADYVTPQHSGIRLERARELLLEHLGAASAGLIALKQKGGTLASDEVQKKWRLLYGVIDEVVMRIYFAADIDPNLRERKEHPLDDQTRAQFFRDALPVLEKILGFGKQPEFGMLLAPTAHHFMELLNGVLRYDPPLVLRMAADVVRCSKPFNYNLDSMAMGETVKLVESILADYRDKVQEATSINHLLEVLDAFVEAGWPQALNLVWRLDEIYR